MSSEVPVPFGDGELHLPRSVFESVLDDLAREYMRDGGRQDMPINFQGFGSTRLPQELLGKQPDKRSLLENVKGWPSIAGAAIARRIRGIEFQVHAERFVKGERTSERLDDHILADVLKRPNDVFTGGQLRWLTTWHLLQTGEAYWQKIRDGLGIVRELWPLPPQNTFLVSTDNEIVAGYLVRDGKGRDVALGKDDVIRFWNPDPLTLYGSIGTLGPIATEWDATQFQEEHWRSYFENDASPRIVITGEKGAAAPNMEQQRDFRSQWKQHFHRRLGEQQGTPAFIPSGFTATELSAHGGAQDLVPLAEHRKRQMLMAYGTPPSIVGDVVDVNRAAAETNAYVFDKNTVSPIVNVMVEAITEQSARPDYDDKLRVRPEIFISPDEQLTLAKEDQDLRTGTRSIQQVLEDRGQDPNRAPWGERPILPFGMSSFDPDADNSLESEDDLRSVENVSSSGPNTRGFDLKALWQRQIKLDKRHTSRVHRAVMEAFDLQRSATVRALESWTANDRPTGSDLYTPGAWDASFADVVGPRLNDVFVDAGQVGLDSVSRDVFVLSEEIEEQMRNQMIRLSGGVNKTTLRKLNRILAASVEAGDSLGEITKKIDRLFRDRKRSRTIARTELGRASQAGQLMGFDQSGVVELKQWNTALDGDVRDSHRINGQQVPIHSEFVLNSGEYAQHPLDGTLPPGDLVNCRCFMSPVIETGE